MIRFMLVSLLSLSVAQFSVPNVYPSSTGDLSQFNIWNNLQGLRDLQWKRMFPNCPEEIKGISDMEKQIDEHLKKAETTFSNESVCEDQGNKYFIGHYKNFLHHVCSALDDARKMVDERKIACKGKENELKELHKLLAECARARVKLLRERDIYKEAVKRAMTQSNPDSVDRNEINSLNGTLVNDKFELTGVNGTSNSTEEKIQDHTSEFNSSNSTENSSNPTENSSNPTNNSSNPTETTVKEENKHIDEHTENNSADKKPVEFIDTTTGAALKTFNVSPVPKFENARKR